MGRFADQDGCREWPRQWTSAKRKRPAHGFFSDLIS
jgi:hypothetical protein